jgi:hypothetical protein
MKIVELQKQLDDFRRSISTPSGILDSAELLRGLDELRSKVDECVAEYLAIEDRLMKRETSSLQTPPIPPELREWTSQQHTEEQLLAGLKEIEEQGGTELSEIIQRLKLKQLDRERIKS